MAGSELALRQVLPTDVIEGDIVDFLGEVSPDAVSESDADEAFAPYAENPAMVDLLTQLTKLVHMMRSKGLDDVRPVDLRCAVHIVVIHEITL